MNLKLTQLCRTKFATMTILLVIVFFIINISDRPSWHSAEARSLEFPSAIRRLDCTSFCRRTKFNGYVGGCQCGFTLFSRKRSYNSNNNSPGNVNNNNDLQRSLDESGEEEEISMYRNTLSNNRQLFAER